MDWYYSFNNQPTGPVDDAELTRLADTGVITAVTLVWYGGMINWLPYREARPSALAHAGFSPGLPVAVASGPAPGPGEARCSQCGQIFPGDEVVRVGQYDVCAACKPVLIQKLREGVLGSQPSAGTLAYAGFWIRLGAAFLDFVILLPFAILVYASYFFVYGNHFAELADPHNTAALQAFRNTLLLYGSIFSLVQGTYSAFCVSRFGGTPGKRICELRVVRGTGAPVTFGRAFGRFFVKQLPRAIPFLGLLYLLLDSMFIVFDAERRSLHDQICDTRVIHSK